MSVPRFFEGPEKKVELAVVDGTPSLRELGDDFYRTVVAAAEASVVSHRANEHFDAYLLSESSLFVFDNFITMITCGRTKLVRAVDVMLSRVPTEAISVLIYERKNENWPRQQHTSFFDDARALKARLPGRAVRFGHEHEHAVRVFHTLADHTPEPEDRTLEVLMHGIDPNVAERFHGVAPARGTVHESLELTRSLGGYTIDEYSFSPRGYSLNAMRDASYATLHVTPERIGSYVSFETNAKEIGEAPGPVIEELVSRFGPESFDVMMFESRGPLSFSAPPGYVLRHHSEAAMCGYGVTFMHFYRPPSSALPAVVLPL